MARALAAVAGLALLLGGCGLFSQKSEYDPVSEERPLEVPPDLDAPPQSTAMQVPGGTYSRVQGTTLSRDAAGTPQEGVTRLGGELVLLLGDDPDNAYRRLGYALERTGFEISGQDEGRRSFTIDYTDEVAREQRPGFFSRMILRRKGPPDHSGRYRLAVDPRDDASMITIRPEEGGTAAERPAREVLEALEQRLG